MTPIICLHIVEMHQSDRVKFMFGFEQDISSQPRCMIEQNDTDMQTNWGIHWSTINEQENEEWNNRRNLVLNEIRLTEESIHTNEYINWFRSTPLVFPSQPQFLNDPRQFAFYATQQANMPNMHQNIPQTMPSPVQQQNIIIPTTNISSQQH